MKNIVLTLFSCTGVLLLHAQQAPKNKTDLHQYLLIQKAKDILKYCKAGQYHKLAKYIHPEDGVRFSPLAHVDTSSDNILFKKDFRKRNSNIYFWGYRDNSEDSIILSIPQYLQKIVFTEDALFHNQVEFNNFFMSNDFTKNMDVYYNNDDFVGFYYPGGKEPDNMDWKIVRLVFRKKETTHYLVAVMCEGLLR